MGCLWACALANPLRHSGHPVTQVTLLLRDQAALAEYPGQIRSSDLDRPLSVPAIAITGHTAQALARIDNLLVSTKAQDTLAAVASVAQHLSSSARIVLLQNGLKVQQQLSQRYGEDRVFCLSTSHGAWLQAPFDVIHAGNGDAWLGQLGPGDGPSQARLQSLLALLPARDLNIQTDDNIIARLWRKLAINCAVNALTVIHDCRNGELLNIAQARKTLISLCDEISTVLQAIPGAPAMNDLHAQVHQVLTVTADNVSSTLQDIRRGRTTEIDHLNGYLGELANNHHIPCPVNEAVLQQMRVIESRAIRGGLPAGARSPSA